MEDQETKMESKMEETKMEPNIEETKMESKMEETKMESKMELNMEETKEEKEKETKDEKRKQDQIRLIMTQTNYTMEEAEAKMEQFGHDPVAVIHDYLGIKPQKKIVKSVKQEMFRQFRKQLDIQEYRDKHPVDLNQVMNDFVDNDQRQQEKNKR